MKTILTAIFFLSLWKPAFSQRFRIDFEGHLGFYNFKASGGSNFQYSTNHGIRSGIGLTYNFSDKVSVTSGLGYNVISYKVEYGFVTLQPNDPLVPVTSEFRPGYLEIPVLVNYHYFRKTKTNLYLSGGLISSHLISENDKTTFQDNSVRNSDYLNSQLFSFQIGAGALFLLNEKLGIKLEPQYRIFFKGFDKFMSENFGGQNPSAINASFGIIYYPGKNQRG